MHTACVWSEKLPFAGYSVVKDHSGGNIAPRNLSEIAGRFPPGTPVAHSLAEPQGPAPFVRLNLDCPKPLKVVSSRFVVYEPRPSAATSQRGLNGLASNKVENTGLEPVTSWLQTRRSPS
jgi:hypothetical protein